MTFPRLCEYKDIGGKPGEGVHAARFMGMAAFDLFGTILGSIGIAYIGNFSILLTVIILLILGIFAHWLFCVDTAMIIWLGLAKPIIDNKTDKQ